MKRIVFILLFFTEFTFAQNGMHKYFISFTDKANSTYSINSPEEYLSSKTIARRNKFFIGFDSTDLPVNKWYVDSIINFGFQLGNTSKWFNGILVSTTDSLLINDLNFSFIDTIIYFGSWNNKKAVDDKWNTPFNSLDYGSAYNQLQMLGGDKMHQKGFKGKGMTIAVIDAGFYKVDELDVFSDIQDHILVTYDFVDGNTNVYDDHTHGMMVLSTMGGNAPGKIIGTAPEADYLLLRSEDVFSENLIEEYMWVCAAEFADSAGADIINSSLGYTTFDDTIQNHTYADMDGKTTPISIAATMAADKGIIVVNSAGNSGNSSWHYIGAPADAINIITVGAVDENKNFANFSSYGPSSDGRVKPTLMAQGKNTIVATSNDTVMSGNGTSFSSPVTAGMLACLWGSNPEKSNLEIMDAVIKSCDRYLNPDDQFGYGIPDYYEALKDCSDNLNFYISGEYFNFTSSQEERVDFSVYSIEGKLVSKGSFYSPFYWVDIKPKSEGIYVVYFQFKGEEFTSKFIVLE